MDYETIRFEVDGAVGVLTLDRPKCLNAVSRQMCDELTALFKALATDDAVRVVVLTGAGRGFSAGMDLKDPALTQGAGTYTPAGAYTKQRTFSDLILAMRRCPQPLVAAVNGVAVGAGFAFAMASDVRLAAPEAKFQAAYINLGLGGADMGSSYFLPRAVGAGNAARYLLTGDFLVADEALRIGFVQDVVEAERLLDEALKLARRIAKKSPLGLKLTKEALDQNGGGPGLEEAIRLEDRNQAMCIAQLMAPKKK